MTIKTLTYPDRIEVKVVFPNAGVITSKLSKEKQNQPYYIAQALENIASTIRQSAEDIEARNANPNKYEKEQV